MRKVMKYKALARTLSLRQFCDSVATLATVAEE